MTKTCNAFVINTVRVLVGWFGLFNNTTLAILCTASNTQSHPKKVYYKINEPEEFSWLIGHS